jgi:hypothetical protein
MQSDLILHGLNSRLELPHSSQWTRPNRQQSPPPKKRRDQVARIVSTRPPGATFGRYWHQCDDVFTVAKCHGIEEIRGQVISPCCHPYSAAVRIEMRMSGESPLSVNVDEARSAKQSMKDACRNCVFLRFNVNLTPPPFRAISSFAKCRSAQGLEYKVDSHPLPILSHTQRIFRETGLGLLLARDSAAVCDQAEGEGRMPALPRCDGRRQASPNPLQRSGGEGIHFVTSLFIQLTSLSRWTCRYSGASEKNERGLSKKIVKSVKSWYPATCPEVTFSACEKVVIGLQRDGRGMVTGLPVPVAKASETAKSALRDPE